jgi:hypothetical protein
MPMYWICPPKSKDRITLELFPTCFRIDIPDLVQQFPPIPPEEKFGRLVEDLRTLATIETHVEALYDGALGEELQVALSSTMERLQASMPEDVTFSRQEETVAAA